MTPSHRFKAGIKAAGASLVFLMCQPVWAASYNQVHEVVFATPKQSKNAAIAAEQAVYAAGKLPAYQVSASQFGKQRKKQLAERTKKTLVDTHDYYPRLEKLVHSNGICMAGMWHITKPAKNAKGKHYTGMFSAGASSLFIGRLSVALSETTQDKPQAFGMAGKLFGTMNAAKPVTTANFFVGDVLSGVHRNSVFEAPMTTKPKFGVRLGVLRLGLKLGGLFSKADKNPGIRPISNIARLGLKKNTLAVAPAYMMLQHIKPKNHQLLKGIDFRHEFALSAAEKNQKAARHFAIYVSDTASQPEDKGWQHIGFIQANETTVSYGCDRQLHFAHPKSSG